MFCNNNSSKVLFLIMFYVDVEGYLGLNNWGFECVIQNKYIIWTQDYFPSVKPIL